MLNPNIPWLAKGYKAKGRTIEEEKTRFLLCADSLSDSELPESPQSSRQKRRVKSASHARIQSRSEWNENAKERTNIRPRPFSARPPSPSHGSRHRRIRSAGSVRSRPQSASSYKSYNFMSHAYEDERLMNEFLPHPDHRFLDRHARCFDHTHIHLKLLLTRPQTACKHCGEFRCPTQDCLYRPGSARKSERPPTRYEQYISSLRPKTAPPGGRSCQRCLPAHNHVNRGRIPHFCNFISSAKLHDRNSPSPHPPYDDSDTENVQPPSVPRGLQGRPVSPDEILGEDDWDSRIDVKIEPAKKEEPIHVCHPPPSPPPEVPPPCQPQTVWQEPTRRRAPSPPPRVPTPPPPVERPKPVPPPSPPKVVRRTCVKKEKKPMERKPAPKKVEPPKEPEPPPPPTPPPPKSPTPEPPPLPAYVEPPKKERPEVAPPPLPDYIEPVKEIPEKKEAPPSPRYPIGGEPFRVDPSKTKMADNSDPEIQEIADPGDDPGVDGDDETPVETPILLTTSGKGKKGKKQKGLKGKLAKVRKKQKKKKDDVETAMGAKPEEPPEDDSKTKTGRPKEILDIEMKLRRRELELMESSDHFGNYPKQKGGFMQWRMALSQQACRFELPMDMKLLEEMTPADYLRTHCHLSSKRLTLYRKIWDRHREKNGLVPFRNLEKVLNDVLIHTVTKERYTELCSLMEINEDTSIDFKLFSGICAVFERVLYPKFVTEDTADKEEYHRERIECADFSALNWKFTGVDVKPSVKKLLHSIAV